MLLIRDILAEIIFRRIIIQPMLNKLLRYPINTFINLVPPQILSQSINIKMPDIVHLLVDASRDILMRPSVNSSPVTHDKAIETEHFAQLPGQQVKVGAGVDAINFVLTAHCGADPGINCCFEWRVVNFMLCSLVDNGVLLVTVRFPLIVCEVLHRRNDTVALNSSDHWAN